MISPAVQQLQRVGPVIVENDQTGLQRLFAWTARPPRKETPNRPANAITILSKRQAELHRKVHGKDDPSNPRKGKQSLGYYNNGPMLRLYKDFENATLAGRALINSLYAKDFGNGERVEMTVKGRPDFKFHTVALPHSHWIRDRFENQKARDRFAHVRRDVWERWLPTIHVAAAFSWAIDCSFASVDNRPSFFEICRSLLSVRQDPILTSQIIAGAKLVATAADEADIFKKEHLISFELEGPRSARI